MGKTNKANRTKGNMRPSSSGHSAELLGLNSRALGGFVGFDSLGKDTPTYVPVTGQNVAAADNTVDSDFRMVMRKMLKRDAITRLKAIQEFGDHCAEKDKDTVKNVLPFWPRLFNRLALDFDRRVREATHQANGKLLSKVKRDVAPFLKSVMGVWLVGQCDSHAPTSSAAQATFADTFPPLKQSEAVLFCREEIFAYFKDNLFEQTVKSMSEPNTSTPEDMEGKYNLVMSATLQALKLFLVIVKSSKQNDSVREDVQSVVANGKFWKYSKSKEAQIRGAWYSLVGSICQLMPGVFEGMEKKLATTVFSCLSESDPLVAPSVWESALSVAVNLENCWQGIDIQKVALPQLWSLLQGGGKGNASALFPCLLPFLSRLPAEIVESEAFLQQFFSAFVKGLMLDSVKRSTTECDAILSAFFECLQFMCCTRLGEEKGPKLMEDILLNQVIPLLDAALHGQDAGHLSVSRLCPLLAGLLARLEGTSRFSKVLESFWQRILPIALGVFTSLKQWETGLVFLAYFFNSLFEGDTLREKKTVRFVDEDEKPQEEPPPLGPKKSPSILASKGAISFPHIIAFCAKLCGEIEKEPSRSLGYTRLLEEILTSACNEDIVEELARTCLKEESDGLKSTPRLVQKIILKWIQESKMEDEKLDCLINIALIACSFMSLEESKKILDLCCTVDVNVVEHLLRRGLVVCRDAPFFRSWFGSSCCSRGVLAHVREFMETKKLFTEDVSQQKVNGSARVLELCLLDADAELLIDDESFKILLSLLNDLSVELFATKFVEENCDVVLMFIHDVTTALLKNSKRCWKFATEQLVYLLFNPFLKNFLLFENLVQVGQLFFDILAVAIDSYISAKEQVSTDSSLIHKMAKEMNIVLRSMQDLREASHLKMHCLFLLSSVRKSLAAHKPAAETHVTYKLTETLLPSPETWAELREGFAVNKAPFFLRKKIFFPLSFDEEFFYPHKNVYRLNLATEVISAILDSDTLDFQGDDEETPERSHIVEHLPHLLWCLTFCRGTRKRIQLTFKTFERQLMDKCAKMLCTLQSSEIDTLKQNLLNLALVNGEWAICLQTLAEIFPSCGVQSFAEEQFKSSSVLCTSEGIEKYMLRQVLIPYLCYEKKLMYFEELLIELRDMKNVSDNDYCGKMGELCCYFQDATLLRSIELETHMMPIFKTIAVFLIETDDTNWKLAITYHLQMGTIVSSAISRGLYLLNSEVWNFFIEELLGLFMESGVELWTTPRSLIFLHRTLSIYTSMCRLYVASREQGPETILNWKPPRMPDVFHKYLFQLFISVAMKEEKTFLPEVYGLVLDELLAAVQFIPAETLVELLLATDDESNFEKIIAFLSSTVRQLQLSSHMMLIEMMPMLPEILREPDEDSDEDGEKKEDSQKREDSKKKDEFERIPFQLEPLLEKLHTLNEMVETLLGEVKVGDLCNVVPHTDSYCLSMAYLLAWIQVLEFIAAAPSQIRLGYATDLQEKGLLPSLFTNVFRMMPENPVLCLKKGMHVDTPRKEDLRALFLNPPAVHTGSPSAEEIQIVACYVYAMALRKVPASVRTWFNNLDRKSADIVNNFTTKYVSSHICSAEIQAVHEIGKEFENLVVHARPGSREVIATYTVDDASIELCVQLPPNHPLSPICTEKRGRVGVGEAEWRQWLLQLKTTLTYQNGSILDGLSMWKRNLDKKFEGVEECMICYYVLHSSSLKLPRLSCHVCRKKFHSECLYKWFHTSNNSTCPLCRNDFRM